MATVLLAAAGAAFGSGFGGTVLGLSGAVVGRAVGATVGRAIDQRMLGLGSEAVEVGRVDRLRVMGASEGTAVAKSWGRVRLPGQVIWASPFQESSARSGGGKGAPRQSTVQFSYSVSLAIALCEGEILGIGRIWADGAEIEPVTLNLRVYTGSAEQLPDPVIEADLGFGMAPAFRDTAYVVIESMDLSPFGNRVPQLSFEVMRQANAAGVDGIVGYAEMIRAVALIPGTGEYALATDRVQVPDGVLGRKFVNVNSRAGVSNFTASFDQLKQELPNCKAVSLVVSWFGNDLRCNQCEVRPKVEQIDRDGINMPWRAGGIGRSEAAVISQQDGRPIYGGTPADASVVQAIRASYSAGRTVMFYPFILMDQLAGNGLEDPYGNAAEQPVLPWRGRITLSISPDRLESSDLSIVAKAEVQSFFGSTQASDFFVENGSIYFTGLARWTYRRFILHYAHLCKIAGGVEAFCIGSELRGLTQIRGENHTFPAVEELKKLAADVRSVLGPDTKISYAADWSEYFGYHVDGNVYFHLDQLWSDPEIDFIGIDNYMPMSDWRDESTHKDSHWKTIANIDYLKSNICGGEGYDWYYDTTLGRNSQLRTPIEDDELGEHWVFRYKDLRSWWSNLHYDRIDGERDSRSTGWIPESKPIWFTEYGCAAVDKATNEPNKFLDSKSSESSLPLFSIGERDDYLQFQYYRAMHEYWNTSSFNPASNLYSGRMIDTQRLFAWAWDARPYPEFPKNEVLWSDGTNYDRGHWLNGRVSSVTLENLIREVCADAGVDSIDTQDLHGLVSGYISAEMDSVRSIFQPLSVTFGFDVIEGNGQIRFMSRGIDNAINLDIGTSVTTENSESSVEFTRSAEAEIIGKSRLFYISSETEFSVKVVESSTSKGNPSLISDSDFSICLSENQAKSIVDRWLAEAGAAIDSLKIVLPASACSIRAGSVLRVLDFNYRIDRLDTANFQTIEAIRIDASHYAKREGFFNIADWKGYESPSPILAIWMDLPIIFGSDPTLAPCIALSGSPWSRSVSIWDSDEDSDYRLLSIKEKRSVVGVTLNSLQACRTGVLDRGPALRVKLKSGSLTSIQMISFLNGENCLAIGDGSVENWEIIQFLSADLIDEDTYDLSIRLRGQAGTEGDIVKEWPTGSTVVLIDLSAQRTPVRSDFQNIIRNYRIGDSTRGYGDDAATHHVLAIRGISLRPFRVAHLSFSIKFNGDHHISWVRQSRIDADNWDLFEVPLGEASEIYEVSIVSSSGDRLRSCIVSTPSFCYSNTQMIADNITESFEISVSQISSSYGLGPSLSLKIFV